MRHKTRKKLLDTIREALASIQIINQKLNVFFNFKLQTGRKRFCAPVVTGRTNQANSLFIKMIALSPSQIPLSRS